MSAVHRRPRDLDQSSGGRCRPGLSSVDSSPGEWSAGGPPKHYHEEQDEWFYCLAGEYVVEIGEQRFRLDRAIRSSDRDASHTRLYMTVRGRDES